ncbi:MAG: nuclear transport factor 2 family protein [Betaproteobacteria bacterium]|nr:nuclear transport factor 2 family protein [Betaproteobacteria bacterium]
MTQSLGLVSLVVGDYDEAIQFFVETLGFHLMEDTHVPEQDKRWVIVSPPGATESQLLFARASTPEQASRIGAQTGGRVFLFLYTDDFRRDYEAYRSRGVVFVREARTEAYGEVAVFRDLYGNLWDLIQLAPDHPRFRGGRPGVGIDAGMHLAPRQLVLEWVKRFNAADIDGLVSLYADDAVNHQVVMDPLAGRAAIRRMFEVEFGRAEMVCIVENVFEDGEWAILEWSDPKGLRGSGFFHVRDGRIVFQRGYFDQLSFFRQQGIAVPERYLGR